jgi:sirohydrochlorin cobaltochelatase
MNGFRSSASFVFVLTLAACASTGGAETGGAEKGGVIVMAHGGDPAWNANFEAAVKPVAEKWPTEIAYGMAVTSVLQNAVTKLEAQGVTEIAVVRMFVSGESFAPETEYILGLRKELSAEQIAAHQAIGMGGHGGHGAKGAPGAHGGHGGHGEHKMEAPQPINPKAVIRMSRDGVGDSPLVDTILVDRVKTLSTNPAEETVLILAHGPGDDAENERWLASMKKRMEVLSTVGSFRTIEVETLREDWPEKRAAAEQRIRAIVQRGNENGGRVIVVPFRISGFGPYTQVLEGLTYVADKRGFLPHPIMTRWIEETATSLLEQK